jgi:hypothetical protein
VKTAEEAIAEAPTVEEAIGLACGAVSVCWDDISYAGVFQSDRAKTILEAAIARVHELNKENQ